MMEMLQLVLDILVQMVIVLVMLQALNVELENVKKKQQHLMLIAVHGKLGVNQMENHVLMH